MFARVLALVSVTALLAGCANVQIEGLQRNEAAPQPYYAEYRAMVAPRHEANYTFEVDPRATFVNVTMMLSAKQGGLALPGVAPASLQVELADALGTVQGLAQLDPSRTSAHLVVDQDVLPGTWVVRVVGQGASGAVEGADYGASYILTVEVLHA